MKFQEFYDQFHIWIVKNGQNYIFGLIVFFAGLWFIKALRARLRSRMSKRKVHSTLQPFFLSLTITGLYVLLIISVMQLIGFQLTIFTTIIGAFSVAAGLALSGTFQNFAGGVLILLLKPFDLDDFIVAQGQEGKVTSIQIFYTVLLTPDNKTIIIPNGKLFNEVIVNVSREGKRRLDFEVKLAYANDVDKAIQIMQDAIKSTSNILSDPAVRVGVIGLEVDSIRYTINVWVLPDNFLTAKIALMERIIKDLGAAGIAFPKAG
ncbi:MAG: mechanosensitive ion channel family protein [Mucilaginibacter sp.]|nr:mechanosensitive ion channel family protein [Mucilaginibacter sp.]